MSFFGAHRKAAQKKARSINELTENIAALRLPEDINPDEDLAFATEWIDKLYEAVEMKPSDTELLNIMAKLTGILTTRIAGVKKTRGNANEDSITEQWIKAFSP